MVCPIHRLLIVLILPLLAFPAILKAQEKRPDAAWFDRVTLRLCATLEDQGERVQLVPTPDHHHRMKFVRTAFLRRVVEWTYDGTELCPSWGVSRETATVRMLASLFNQSRFDPHCVFINHVNDGKPQSVDRGIAQINSCHWKPMNKEITELQRFCRLEGVAYSGPDMLFDARFCIRFAFHLNEIFIQKRMKRWVYDWDAVPAEKKIYTSLLKLVDDVPLEAVKK